MGKQAGGRALKPKEKAWAAVQSANSETLIRKLNFEAKSALV